MEYWSSSMQLDHLLRTEWNILLRPRTFTKDVIGGKVL